MLSHKYVSSAHVFNLGVTAYVSPFLGTNLQIGSGESCYLNWAGGSLNAEFRCKTASGDPMTIFKSDQSDLYYIKRYSVVSKINSAPTHELPNLKLRTLRKLIFVGIYFCGFL